MDSYMGSYDSYEADEMTFHHEQNLLHRHQLAEPHQIGTKTPRVNENGSSYGVNAAPAPMVQQVPSIDQYFMPVLPERLDSPNVADQNKLKRKSCVARDPGRKRMIDMAYRQRCREKKLKTEAALAAFTEENKRLKTENSQSKQEEVRLLGIVQTQNETVKQLQREVGQLKGELDRQKTVVDVLSKQLAEFKYVDFQLENEQLKNQNALLINQINNPNTMEIIQLQKEITQLKSEVSSKQLVIDALSRFAR